MQLSPGDGSADVVQIAAQTPDAPNLKRLLTDGNVLKIFHFARFDLGMLQKNLGVMPEPVYCTKIASRLTRTYTDKHGLKDLVREILGHDLSKQQQSSDWGAAALTDAQVSYAASDVLYLHALREKLDVMLAREGRDKLAAACFRFLPDRVRLDLAGLPRKTFSLIRERRRSGPIWPKSQAVNAGRGPVRVALPGPHSQATIGPAEP